MFCWMLFRPSDHQCQLPSLYPEVQYQRTVDRPQPLREAWDVSQGILLHTEVGGLDPASIQHRGCVPGSRLAKEFASMLDVMKLIFYLISISGASRNVVLAMALAVTGRTNIVALCLDACQVQLSHIAISHAIDYDRIQSRSISRNLKKARRMCMIVDRRIDDHGRGDLARELVGTIRPPRVGVFRRFALSLNTLRTV